MKIRDASIENLLARTPFFNRDGLGIRISMQKILIEDINLTLRCFKILKKANISTLQELLNTTPNELLKLRNCGEKSIEDNQFEIRYFILHNQRIIENNLSLLEPTFIHIPLLGLVSNELASNLEKFRDSSLSKENLPTRFRNYLSIHEEIKTLGDLINIDYKDLVKTKNLGKTTVTQLVDEVRKIGENNFSLITNQPSDPQHVLDFIDDFVEKLEPKKKKILIMRWNGENKCSYQEIGEKLFLTRERIRQILNSIEKSLASRIFSKKDIFYKYFLGLLLENPSPITFDLLNSHPLFNRGYSAHFYLGILSELFTEVPFEGYLLKNFEQYITRYQSSQNIFAFYFDKLSRSNIPFKQITPEKLFELLNAKTNKDKIALLYTIFNSKDYWFEFDSKERKYYLFNKGNLYEITKNLLDQSPTILTVEQIIKTIKELYKVKGKYGSNQTVVGNLKQHNDIYQLDRYSFGLKKHFSYKESDWDKICLEVKNRIGKLNRQTNVTELFDHLKNKYPKLISKYELVYIIRSDKDILDLGWYNFAIKELGVEKRIKVSDAILEIFKQNREPKHYSEIQNEILEKRFIRTEAINSILKNIEYLEYYRGGFYGLIEFHNRNLLNLAKKTYYIRKIISNDIYPATSLNKILEVFQNEKLEETIKFTIESDNALFLLEDTEAGPFIILKDWSIVRIVRCILFNLNRTVYLDELNWILSDVGISINNRRLYKLRNDKYINFDNNKLSYVEFRLTKDDADEIIEISYDLLKDSISQESIEEFCDYLNKEYVEITIDELIYLLESDERFIIIDRQMILVK